MSWLDDIVGFAQTQVGERERDALQVRGVTDAQTKLFRIGYLNKFLPVSGPPEFQEWSWKGRRLDDVFVFPLTNALNEIRGVQFRHVDKSRKGYLDYFIEEDEPVLFGLGEAIPHIWASGQVVLVEGVYDLCPVQRVFPDVVATLRAGATEGFLRLLRRFVNDIWLAYDMDKTGRSVSFKFAREHRGQFKVHDFHFPQFRKSNGDQAKDPGDLWEVLGDERLGVLLKSIRSP